jgi:TonB family protein
MKTFLVLILIASINCGCDKEPGVEIIPDYNSIYLPADKVDKTPQPIENDEGKLVNDVKEEMNKNSLNKMHLEYILLLNENGKVEKLLPVNSGGINYSKIIAYNISNWSFEPAVKDGRAVKSQYKWQLSLPEVKEIEVSKFEVSADTMPSPVGGMLTLQKNVIYPKSAKQSGIEGKVIVQAFIDETGKVLKTVVLKSAGDALDLAAVNAIEKTAFTPGKAEGKAVKVRIVIPIVFKLN